MPMRRLLVSGLCVLAVVLPTACGGDDDDGGGGGGRVAADKYADSLCKLLADFAEKAEKSVDDAGLAEAFAGGGNLENVEDLPELIKGLGTMFTDLQGMFVDLGSELDDLGTPDVEGGAEFQKKLTDAVDKGGDLVGEAGDALKETDPDSLSDLTALGPVFEDFEKAFDEVDIDPATDAPKEVAEAYEKADSCKKLEGEEE